MAAAAAVQAAGCGFFDIREPAEPVGPSSCPRANPVDPESVLVNFESAIRCKENGLSIYDESLADGFQLVLDIVDAQDLSLDSLSKAQDLDAQQILSETVSDSLDFAFTRVEPERSSSTIARYLDMPYVLRFLRRQGSVFVPVDSVRGIADTLSVTEQANGTWAVSRWVDQRQAPFLSFGRWHGDRVISTAPRP
jgi:hypothetical protein